MNEMSLSIAAGGSSVAPSPMAGSQSRRASRRLSVPTAAAVVVLPERRHDDANSLMRWLAPLSMRPADERAKFAETRNQLGYCRLESGQSIPSRAELLQMPPEMQATVRDVCMGILQFRLGPMVAVYMRRRAKSVLLKQLLGTVREAGSPPSPSLLAQLPCFAGWDSLSRVADAFVPRCYVQGDVVVHQGEREFSGLFCLAWGSARVKQTAADRIGQSPASIVAKVFAAQHQQQQIGGGGGGDIASGGLSHAAGVRLAPLPPTASTAIIKAMKGKPRLPAIPVSFASGAILGDAVLSTQHPQRHSIQITSQDAVVYVLPLQRFHELLAEQSADVRARIVEAAALFRTHHMREAYPVTQAILRSYPYFARLSDEAVDDAVEKFSSKVFSPGTTVYKVGEHATTLLFLVRGEMHLKRGNAVVGRVRAPAMFGDLSWMQLTKRQATCVADGWCDCFVLTKDSMKSTLATEDVQRLLLSGDGGGSSSRNQQQQQQQQSRAASGSTNFLRFVPYVRAIPLLTPMLPELDDPSDPRFPLLQDLAESFVPRVFTPKTAIASATQECDHLVVLLSGSAVAQIEERKTGRTKNVPLVLNEPIGFTSLVAHRWAHRVVAVDTVEALMMHVDVYRRVLKKHKLFKQIHAMSTALLFPEAVSEGEAEKARAMIAAVKNPALYPVSQGFTVEEVCRYPTEDKLSKLKPIRVTSQLTASTFTRGSMSRIVVDQPLPANGMVGPDGVIKPMVLGKVTRVTMAYKQGPKLEAS